MTSLSIVIPTHNRPAMLLEAVESALCQTVQSLEVIVIDDGSEPPVVLNNISDQRLRLHRNRVAGGVSAARNLGLSLATGEYIAYLDDDDQLLPDYASKMLEFFGKHGEQIDFAWPTLAVLNVFSGKSSFAQQHACLIRRDQPATEDAFAATGYIRTTGMIFRTESLKNVGGFDESLSVSEDRELIFRMLSKGFGCGAVLEPLVSFYIHGGPRLSTSDNLLKQAYCDEVVANRHSEFINHHAKLAAKVLNLLARRQREAGLYCEYRKTLYRLLNIKIWDLRALRRLILSFILYPPTGCARFRKGKRK